jgi:hypothetical protein
MAIERDVKTLSRRLDRTYFERRSAIRRVRIALIVFCLGGVVAWWALAGGATGDERMFNPGHVMAAHASFEHDCRACHTGAPDAANTGAGTVSSLRGKFSLSVTDAACLKCHDAAIHHPNQKFANAHAKEPGNANLNADAHVLAVADTGHPAGMRSGSCVSCHIEHKGETLMKAGTDATCIACHANLQNASQTAPHAASRVVAFNKADHPDFGRSLLQEVDGTKRPVDPTVISFNHRKHLAIPALGGDASCIKCHEAGTASLAAARPTTAPSATAQDAPRVPPFTRDTDPAVGDAFALAATEGRYMQPVRFDRHCVGCHQITAPAVVLQTKRGPRVTNETLLAETPVPHQSLDIVRAFVSDRLAAEANAKSPADLAAREAFFTKASDKLTADLASAKQRDGAWKGTPASFAAPATQPAAAALPGQGRLASLYTSAIAINPKGCVLCHTLEAATDRAALGPDLQTVPTGIPAAPRRWFARSEFDHSKHRIDTLNNRPMSCIDCHATLSTAYIASKESDPALPQAERTSYVNVPGLTWQTTEKKGDTFTTTTRSCVDCHHASTNSSVGVASNCVSCHQFHDRTKER